MSIHRYLFPALLALALIPGASQAAEREPVNRLSPPAASERPARVERTHRLIVRYADGTRGIAGTAEASGVDAATHARQKATQLGAQMGESMRFVRHASGRTQVLALPEPRAIADMEALAARLTALPEVEYAEPDRRRYIMSVDDEFFENQWHYLDPEGSDIINGVAFPRAGSANVEAAWEITTGSDQIVVAVLDTGLRPHPDIVGDGPDDDVETGGARNLPGFDMVSDENLNNDDRETRTGDATDPGDFVTEAESNEDGGFFEDCPTFSSWHGTHVGGTIGAITGNDRGVAGVDQNARLLPVRVLGKCFGQSIDIIDGIRWAAGLDMSGVDGVDEVNPNPAHVINLSLGGESPGGCSTFEQEAIDDARAAGAIIIAAAGNEQQDAGNVSPANCNGVITVAALARDGSRAFYSNFGSVVDIAAPGGEDDWPPGVEEFGMILSTFNEGEQEPGNEEAYAWSAGTSMAAPHVAGVVSLMLSLNDSLTPDEVASILKGTAREFPQPGGDEFDCNTNQCGAGIVDARAAVAFVQGEQLTIQAIADQSLRRGSSLVLDVIVADASGGYELDYALNPDNERTGTITLNDDVFEWENIGPTGEYELTFTATSTSDPLISGQTSLTITVRSKPSSGSNFFGCTSAPGARPDPLFALMLFIAMGWIVARARRGHLKPKV